MRTWNRNTVWTLLLILWALVAAPLSAQLPTGDLYGTVTTDGQPLPGATVTLTGADAQRTTTTDDRGRFRFLGLAPGAYSVKAEQGGYRAVEVSGLDVRAGANLDQALVLAPEVSDVLVVQEGANGLDPRELSRSVSITKTTLDKVPTARDPWALLTMAPGVTSDRVNVGGIESGQQAVFLGTGANSSENSFSLDGVVITDMSATGSSPTYYDFGTFDQVQLGTGGSDITAAASGVSVNIVTRRGTNDWRGAVRGVTTDEDWGSDPSLDRGDFPAGQDPAGFTPNRLLTYQDFGGDVGGPLVKERLWIWGAFGDTEIETVAGGGIPNNTQLENQAVKLHGTPTESSQLLAQWTFGNKQVQGRGAGPDRPVETTWNQDGPSDIYKLEGSQILGPSFYVEALASRVDSSFALAPQGGLDGTVTIDADGVWHGSFQDYRTERPSDQYRLIGSSFFDTGSANHELRFGVGYRDFAVTSSSTWPGDGIVHIQGENFGIPGNLEVALVTRAGRQQFEAEYESLWLQDTLSLDRWTMNAGLRYDRQQGANLASATAASSRLPGELPAVDFGGAEAAFDWSSVSPRISLSYAAGADRKTLLRASYSQFAQQLATGFISLTNPTALSSLYAFFEDTDSDGLFDNGEPFSLASTVAPNLNRVDPDLEPQTTNELVLGMEHAASTNLVVSLLGTLRRIDDIIDARPLVRETATGLVRPAVRTDYEEQPRTAVVGGPGAIFRLKDGLETTGANLTTNGDRSQDYLGLSLAFEKRLADRWMARGHVTWSDWTWNVPASFAAIDDPTDDVDSADNDGGTVGEQSLGSGNRGDVWLSARWTAHVTGLYQVGGDRPWAFNVGGAVNLRDGYPSPRFHAVVADDGRSLNVADGDFDADRNDTLATLDLRLDKDIVLGPVGLNLGVDIFNVTNESTVLQRERNQSLSRAGFVRETLAPRAFRLGLTLSYE
jgi:Carboxypeptidase regulatory-like domain